MYHQQLYKTRWKNVQDGKEADEGETVSQTARKTHTYTHTHTHTHTHTQAHTHEIIHAHTHAWTQTQTQPLPQPRTRKQTHTHIHKLTHTHNTHAHTPTHPPTHPPTHTPTHTQCARVQTGTVEALQPQAPFAEYRAACLGIPELLHTAAANLCVCIFVSGCVCVSARAWGNMYA